MTDASMFVAAGRRYVWLGGFGAIFQSHERGVKPGDVRVILDQMFYAYMVTRRGWWRAPEVSWTQQGIDVETIRLFKRRAFSIEALPTERVPK